MSDKKTLAIRVYDCTEEIEADIMAVDPVGNLSLEGRFDANLETISSKNRIKTMSNDSLAQWFLDIYPIVDAINSGLVDLHRARQDAAMLTRHLRENILSSGSKLTPTLSRECLLLKCLPKPSFEDMSCVAATCRRHVFGHVAETCLQMSAIT